MRQKIFVVLILIIACIAVQDVLWAQPMTENLSWVKVTEHAGWRPRDSAGEVVYDGKMWLMGGWFNSGPGPFPSDVWSSADGIHWKLVTPAAPWVHGDLATTLVFDNKMWIMAGWSKGRLPDASASNQVWYSNDGAVWKQATSDAPWAARVGTAGAVHNGKMWILGGIKNYFSGTNKDLLNDVWSSSDGIHWEAATLHAPWSPRAYHQVLAFDNKLWVMGGGNYTPTYWSCNDVWNSSDGVNWTKVTESAPWDPRIWFSAVVYKNRMWILSGTSYSNARLTNDMWYSSDGANWTELKTDNTWLPGHEQSAYVFQDKLWVVGGGNGAGLMNDVWQLDVPDWWFEQH